MKHRSLTIHVTIMLAAVMTLAAVMMLPAFPVEARTIDVLLAEKLAEAERTGDIAMIPVIVEMKEEADLETVREGDAAAVCLALRHTAEESQRDLLAQLTSKNGGGATDITSFWGVIAVAFTATPDVIESVSQRRDVGRVYLDSVHTLPEEPRSPAEFPEKSGAVWSVEKIKAARVWDTLGLTGAGVEIGHIDSGVAGDHPDLTGRIKEFRDFSRGGIATEPIDDGGHGTHTAGTICGGDASGNTIGVAPGAKLLVARIFDKIGRTRDTWILGAMQWMLDPDGNPRTNDAPPVVSNSWGSSNSNDRLSWNMIRNWLKAGIFPCFAAGNSGYYGSSTMATPASYPHVFAVGSTTRTNALSKFSSRGPSTWNGVEYIKPQVTAPGDQVTSARHTGGWVAMSGTSMACPAVSGVVALLNEMKPDITPAEVRAVLESTARDLGAPGNDNNFGYGLVDALAACNTLKTGGTLVGTTCDVHGNPIRATVKIFGRTLPLDSGGEGTFAIFLESGNYTVQAETSGYYPFEKSVAIRKGQATMLDIRFEQAAPVKLYGRVTSNTGLPLAARIVVLGDDMPETRADENGYYELRLPAGPQTLRVFHTGYATAGEKVTIGYVDKELNIILEKLPPVLLVDDDHYAQYETYYTEALRAAGLYFNTRHVSPDTDTLLQYPLVIWFTGEDTHDTLSEQNQEAITGYLAGGGSLLLAGQNIAADLAQSKFLRETLKVNYMDDNAMSDILDGTGGPFTGKRFYIHGGVDAVNQARPDWITPFKDHSTECLQYSNGRGAAVCVEDETSRLIFLGFGFEGIHKPAARFEFMQLACRWLLPTPRDTLSRVEAAVTGTDDFGTVALYYHHARERIVAELDRAVESGDCETIREWTRAINCLEDSHTPTLNRLIWSVGEWAYGQLQGKDRHGDSDLNKSLRALQYEALQDRMN